MQGAKVVGWYGRCCCGLVHIFTSSTPYLSLHFQRHTLHFQRRGEKDASSLLEKALVLNFSSLLS